MNASPSQARSYRAARFPVSLLCVNRRRSLRLLCRLRRRGRRNGGGEGFICGLNASGGGCQHRFTPAQNRLITPLTRVQKCNVAPQTSVIGGKEEGAGLDFSRSARRPRRRRKRPGLPTVPEVSVSEVCRPPLLLPLGRSSILTFLMSRIKIGGNKLK